jgi:hypothetical protein
MMTFGLAQRALEAPRHNKRHGFDAGPLCNAPVSSEIGHENHIFFGATTSENGL